MTLRKETDECILRVIEDKKWVTSREVAEICKVSQSTAQLHLKYLEERGIVKSYRIGNVVFYRSAQCSDCDVPPLLQTVVNLLVEYLEELTNNSKGKVVTFSSSRFFRWIGAETCRKVLGLAFPKFAMIINELFRRVKDMCPECFYDFNISKGRTRIVMYSNKVRKVIELLRNVV